MYSPKPNSSFIKNTLLRNYSSYSSNTQTESTSRISLSELKNIYKLKKSMNVYNSKKKLSKSRNNFHYSAALNLTNNNCLNDFLKEKAKIFPLNEVNKNKNRNIALYKIKSRNDNNFFIHNNTDFSYDKIKEENKNIYKNCLKTTEPLYRYYTARNKSFIDFNVDTRNIRYLKISNYNGKKAMDNLNEYLLFNKESDDFNEKHKSKTNNLMNIYIESLYNYLFYLKKILNDEFLINQKLINQKKILINEIINIKNRANKIIIKFENFLDSKVFLIYVKEFPNEYKNFSKESQIEILYDLYKYYLYKKKINEEFFFNNINNKEDENKNIYSFYYFIKEITQKIKNNNNFDANKRIIFLNYIFISLDEKIFFEVFHNINNNYINSYKQKNIFNNIEEYENILNNIFSQNKRSLTNYNIMNISFTNLREEMKEELDKKKKEASIINNIKRKIDILERRIKVIKANYHNKQIEYNLIKKKNKNIENNIKKIDEKISSMANIILDYHLPNFNFIIKRKNKKDDRPITIIEKMNFYERAFLYLLRYKNDVILKNKEEYDKIIKDIKKTDMIKKTNNNKEIMKQIIILKKKKMFEKNNKILFLPHRKVDDSRIRKLNLKENNDK